MNFSEKNQAYLDKIRMAVVTESNKAFQPEDDAIYTKKDGYYLAERQGVRCFVHSRYNVADEIESMFATAPRDTRFIILFGCGLGDAVRYALDSRNFPKLNSLIIIEPSPAWASIVMNEMDMEKTWGKCTEKIRFLVGIRPDIVGVMLATETMYMREDLFNAYHLSVNTLFFEYYKELLNTITSKIRNISVLLNTNKAITHKKMCNEVLNMAKPTYNFDEMKDLFKGKNIIIVSAGPSLEKNIHLLEEAKKKAVIAAVGSAIRILEARGIIPHVRMALDGSPEEHAIFVNLQDDPTPLIYNNGLYSEILLLYKGPLIRVNLVNDYLSFYLYKMKNYKTMSFLSGPSIANMAAEIFCALGCERLVFMGQDMCMYNYHLHADTGEYLPYKDITNSKLMMPFKDICGNEVVSPRNYYLIKESLENTVARFVHKVDFINATEGGLGIEGVPNKPLADILADWAEDDIAPVIDGRLKEMVPIDFQNELAEFKKKIEDIDIINDKNLKILEKTKGIFLKDESLRQRERYIKAVKAAQKNEKELKKIDCYSEVIHQYLDIFLQTECLQWEKYIDSPDERERFRSIMEIQLYTAQATKSFIIVLKRVLTTAFSEELKTQTFSCVVK